MRHTKDSKEIDFSIESEPLNDKARSEISEFIRAYKAKSGKRPKSAIIKLPTKGGAAIPADV